MLCDMCEYKYGIWMKIFPIKKDCVVVNLNVEMARRCSYAV